MELTVMTYNIASGRYYGDETAIDAQGRIPVDLSQCAGVIRGLGPDVCGINEINRYLPGYPESRGHALDAQDQTGYLARTTGLCHSYFGKAHRFAERGDYGNAILSRFPLSREEVIPIPNPAVYDEDRYYEPRGIARATLEVAGGITLLQVHVGLAVAESQNAVVTLCRLLDETPGPVILMGDFNMCPGNFLLERITRRLQEVRPQGEGYVHSFPSWPREAALPPALRDHPRCKIDYIFASSHFEPLWCRVHPARASDHMPMIARLRLKDR